MAIDGYVVHAETTVTTSTPIGGGVRVKLAAAVSTYYIGLTQLYFPESGVAATVISVNPAGEFIYTGQYIPQPGEPVVVRTPADLFQTAVASNMQGARIVLQVTDSAGVVHSIPVVVA